MIRPHLIQGLLEWSRWFIGSSWFIFSIKLATNTWVTKPPKFFQQKRKNETTSALLPKRPISWWGHINLCRGPSVQQLHGNLRMGVLQRRNQRRHAWSNTHQTRECQGSRSKAETMEAEIMGCSREFWESAKIMLQNKVTTWCHAISTMFATIFSNFWPGLPWYSVDEPPDLTRPWQPWHDG